jgi:hypothetical protein
VGGKPPVNFHALIAAAGSKEGARARFQDLIVQLVKVKHRTARQMQPKQGDWGIDCFVGLLNDALFNWQAKFLIDGVRPDQQKEIRESFKRFVAKAEAEGYEPSGWTLCIPVDLDPPTTKWWDGWKERQERETGCCINLWDKSELESLLLAPDAHYVYEGYFGDSQAAKPELPTVSVPAGMSFEEMLFLKQLRAANTPEIEGAKRQFFNADLMKREVADKGVEAELQELATCFAEVHSIWEVQFNGKCAEHPTDETLPGLYPRVMGEISQMHNTKSRGVIPMGLLHRLGTMHHVVDDGTAGWTRGFRSIAATHLESTSTQTPAAEADGKPESL